MACRSGPALAWTIRAKELSGGLPSSPLAAFIAASSNGFNDFLRANSRLSNQLVGCLPCCSGGERVCNTFPVLPRSLCHSAERFDEVHREHTALTAVATPPVEL
jgi:hypothetical protein